MHVPCTSMMCVEQVGSAPIVPSPVKASVKGSTGGDMSDACAGEEECEDEDVRVRQALSLSAQCVCACA